MSGVDDVGATAAAATKSDSSTTRRDSPFTTKTGNSNNSDTKTSSTAATATDAAKVSGVITTGHHQNSKAPSSSPLFRFVRGQDINSTFFSYYNTNNNSNNSQDDSSPEVPAKQQQQQQAHYYPKPFLLTGQLVWVCKSKGLKQSNKKRRRRGTGGDDVNNNNNGEKQQQQRLEAFLRARIVHGDDEENNNNQKSYCINQPNIDGQHSHNNLHDDNVVVVDKKDEEQEDRLLVRYPKGSTYMVKRNHLWPVLEQETIIRNNNNNNIIKNNNDDDNRRATLVLVFAETNFYRRACMVHTLPDGADIFWEIGCDAGSTIHKMASTLNSSSDNSKNDNDIDDSTMPPCCALRVLGIDKSQESIDEARRLHPNLPFCLWDILVDENKGNNTETNNSKNANTVNNVLYASSLEQAIHDAVFAATCAAAPKTSGTTITASSSTIIQQQQQQQQQQPYKAILSPTVVAIDINGNRELPAVLACLNKVASTWKPRLILVKSRALHGQLSLSQVELIDATLAAMMA
jgi:hypothetical protein